MKILQRSGYSNRAVRSYKNVACPINVGHLTTFTDVKTALISNPKGSSSLLALCQRSVCMKMNRNSRKERKIENLYHLRIINYKLRLGQRSVALRAAVFMPCQQ